MPHLNNSIGVTNSTSAFGLNSDVKDYLSSDIYKTSADHFARENLWVKWPPNVHNIKKNRGYIRAGFLASDRAQYSGPLFLDLEEGR